LLDLGCGTGDDATHLDQRGVRVVAIDASEEMVAAARLRGVDARQMRMEALGLDGPFHHALSNFGALNCVADLRALRNTLHACIAPHGTLILCVMPRFSWTEFARFLRQGDLRRAVRRWSGQAEWRGTNIYYRTRRGIVRDLAPHFQLRETHGIGGDDHLLLIFERRA
jgi:SAM-dependent methyltransferase